MSTPSVNPYSLLYFIFSNIHKSKPDWHCFFAKYLPTCPSIVLKGEHYCLLHCSFVWVRSERAPYDGRTAWQKRAHRGQHTQTCKLEFSATADRSQVGALRVRTFSVHARAYDAGGAPPPRYGKLPRGLPDGLERLQPNQSHKLWRACCTATCSRSRSSGPGLLITIGQSGTNAPPPPL